MIQDPLYIIQRCSHLLVYGAWHGNEEEQRALLKKLTVLKKLKGYWKPIYKGLLYDRDPYERAILRIPIGVPLELIEKAWPRHELKSNQKGWPSRDIDIVFRSKFEFRNKDQAKITNYLNEDFPIRAVSAGTASGKSYCSIRSWTESSRKVALGTFAQTTHLNNFKSEILKFTNVTEEEILVIDDGRKTIRKAMSEPERLQQYKVALILHRTIANCFKDAIVGNKVVPGIENEFSIFVRALGVGLHVSDECHLELQNLITMALLTNIAKTYYLSATLGRTEHSENKVLVMQIPKEWTLFIKNMPKLKVVQMSYRTAPEMNDYLHEKNSQGYFNTSWYFKQYLMRPVNWELIMGLIIMLINRSFNDEAAKGVGVVLGSSLEFLDAVYDEIANAFPNKTIGNFTSRVKNKMDQLEGEIIVTTDKSFGGSVNPLHLTHLIMLIPISSKIWVEQISGRLRGENGNSCIVFDLYDMAFSNLAENAKARLKTFKSIALEVTQENLES
jgi:hypothetical protein